MTNTEVYPHAGIRIKKVDHDKFAVTIVPTPAADDVTVPVAGANVYLDRPAAAALDHATLDASDDASRAEELVLENADS
jgi:hypothetical protein